MSSKEEWEDFFNMNFWQFYCMIFNEDNEAVPPDDPGKSAYTAVNTARYEQGLPTTDEVPNETYDTSTGHVEYYIAPNNFLYLNDDIDFGELVTVAVYGASFNTPPNLGPSPIRELKYITSRNVFKLNIMNLNDDIVASGIFTAGQYGLLEFRSGFPGSVPRSRQRHPADI